MTRSGDPSCSTRRGAGLAGTPGRGRGAAVPAVSGQVRCAELAAPSLHLPPPHPPVSYPCPRSWKHHLRVKNKRPGALWESGGVAARAWSPGRAAGTGEQGPPQQPSAPRPVRQKKVLIKGFLQIMGCG